MSNLTFTPFMSCANSAKAQHGTEFHEKLNALFSKEEASGNITSFVYKFKVGRPRYSSTQFYAPFMLQFGDGERWLIYSTTSLRDRIKEVQWDAFNIREVDSHVTKVYLAYPTDATPKEKKAFASKNAKYQCRKEYSAIDELVDVNRLIRLIHEKANQYYRSQYDQAEGALEKASGEGKYYDFVGRAFERDVAELLENKDYLSAYNSGKNLPDRKFDHFVSMMRAFGFEASSVKTINATANRRDIGDLPSGGSPKTDVIMLATRMDGTEVMRTISCKRVTGREVSAHQYKADDFADVLDAEDEQLRLHLKFFQTAGNFRDMPEGSVETLGRLMSKHVEKLCRWVVSGEGGGGDERQTARYIVTYRPSDNAFSAHSADEYVKWLMSRPSNKQGGTPFGWTHQGERGKSIQLKMPVWL